MIPTELMIQERVQEHEREARNFRLVHEAAPEVSLSERLRRFGAALFGGDPKPTQHKN